MFRYNHFVKGIPYQDASSPRPAFENIHQFVKSNFLSNYVYRGASDDIRNILKASVLFGSLQYEVD
jgi:hypothetical protein